MTSDLGAPPRIDAPRPKVWPVFFATAAALLIATAISTALLTLYALLFVLPDLEPGRDLQDVLHAVARDDVVGLTTGVAGSATALSWLALRMTPFAERRGILRLDRPAAFDVLLTVLGMLALTAALSELIALLDLSDYGALEMLRAVLSRLSLAERASLLPVTAVAAAFAEELFFRGYALGKLERALGSGFAILLSAALFGAIHLDPLHSIAAAMMGLYLGYAAFATGSVWTTIAAHFVNNAIATLAPELAMETDPGRVAVIAAGLAGTGLAVWGLSSGRTRRRSSAAC